MTIPNTVDVRGPEYTRPRISTERTEKLRSLLLPYVPLLSPTLAALACAIQRYIVTLAWPRRMSVEARPVLISTGGSIVYSHFQLSIAYCACFYSCDGLHREQHKDDYIVLLPVRPVSRKRLDVAVFVAAALKKQRNANMTLVISHGVCLCGCVRTARASASDVSDAAYTEVV